MSRLGTITRRTFLIGSAAIAGGVVFGYWKYKQPFDNPLSNDLGENEATLNPYILINQSGITIIAPRAEMGQGVHTTLAALVAEELDVTLADVNVIHGPASKAYYNAAVLEEGVPFAATDNSQMAETMRGATNVVAKFVAMQITGGSSSTPDAYDKMRLAGAAAREVLIQAAAQRLNVPISSLITDNASVVSKDGQRISYTELAVASAQIKPPEEPKLKPQSQWKILGKSQKRVDIVDKTTGSAQYSIDIDLPNMLYATVKMNPHLGAPMNSFDASTAKTMTGVKDIFQINNGVAVIASNTWYAFQAANAIKFDWDNADYPNDTASLSTLVEDSFAPDHLDHQERDDGDVEQVLEQASDNIITAEYRVPYLAHAAMEPLNATAWLRDGKLDICAGNQLPTQIVKEAAQITGLDENSIKVHTTLMGGGFGRRAEIDFVTQAVKIAKKMHGTPVKVTWTREEDTTHDFYRPTAIARFKAVLGEKSPLAVDLDLSCPSVAESQMGRLGVPAAGPDFMISRGASDQPYAIENYRVSAYRTPASFPVSSWRSVGASQNGFFHESMMDEIAHAQDLDPMQMRLDLIKHEASHKVLQTVKRMSQWDSELPSGHGRGVAFTLSFGVPVAQVIEVAAQQDGRIKIIKAYAAVDVGTALDPDNIKAQVMGGLNFGLAAAMMGEITIENGKVQQTNFDSYKSLRMHQAPDVEVEILENGEKIRGIGEPGTPPAAPALANAIFAATGKRIRQLPLNKEIDFV